MQEEAREKGKSPLHLWHVHAGEAREGHWHDTSGGPHLNRILITLARSRYLGVVCRDSEAH